MNIQTVVVVVVIIAAMLIREHRRKQSEADDEQRLFDSARLQGEIESLYHAAQQLQQLDQMIIDLRLCKPDELHKAFRIEWQGSTKSHSFDFFSTGANTNTAHLIELAEDQREEVNAEIQERIIDLYSRAQEFDFMESYSRERSEQNGEQNDSDSGQGSAARCRA